MYTGKELHGLRQKLKVFAVAKECGNVSLTCRRYGISREIFYTWKRRYEALGERGLINGKPCPQNLARRVKPEIEEKILYLRTTYHFGQQRIVWYLQRYHGIKISTGGVRGVLIRDRLQRLPQHQRKRSIKSFTRYEKQVPGHHVQVDVKFLFFKDKQGNRIKRFQYTAIDDATRIHALKVYDRHSQVNAIDFINYVVDVFPFRIKVIRTDKQEFYQLLDYRGDVDLRAKLRHWENFYNFQRPHTSLKGKTPYEILREKLL